MLGFSVLGAGLRATWSRAGWNGSQRWMTSFKQQKEILANLQRKVFVWGAGGEFQLATEHPHDGSPKPLEVEPLRGIDIESVTAGWVTSFVLTARGDVYGWGSNQNFALPSGPTDPNSHFSAPIALALNHPKSQETLQIKKVVAGRGHTLFLDQKGDLFAIGMSDLGQLGTGLQGENAHEKKLVQVTGALEDRVVVDVVCGLDHNLALTDKGELFSWGFAADGQLGLGELGEEHEIIPSPQKISYLADGQSLPPISRIFAGSDNSALLAKSGQVYIWGSNNCRQLGLGLDPEEVEGVLAPYPLEGGLKGVRVAEVSLGGTQGFAKTEDGRVFVWGWNGDVGRLAMPESVDHVAVPMEHEQLSKLKPRMIKAGGGHTIVVSHDGLFYSFGFGAAGRLGLGAENPEKSVFAPTQIKLLNPPRNFTRIIDLAAGFDHNVLVVE